MTLSTIALMSIYIMPSLAATVAPNEGISHQQLKDCGNVGTETDWNRTAQLNGHANWQSLNNSLQPGQVIKVSCSGATAINYSPARPIVPGNAYAPGYCTFYVKTRRPDIGNYWGDAVSWLQSARNAGYATGYTPRVGAIAWNGINASSPLGHVAYVEAVNGNYVTVSEMAAPLKYVVSRRTVHMSNFIYIY